MSITSKLTTIVAGFAMVAAMAFTLAVPSAHAALTESQIQSILSLLQSFGADQSTINNVDASLRGTAPSTPSTPSTPSGSCSQFTRDLTIGSTGADVQALQKILNANGYPVAASGAGSPGNESTYFGSLTASALGKWQASKGISPAVGYFGPITRAALASSGACGSSTTGPVTPVPGTGLSVSAASQPQNSIAPQGATRVPFTRFTLTASANGPVTVNSIAVQRVGLGENSSFAGVVLIDQDGNQLGTAKSFNSNNQATIGEPFTIPAGQSRTFTVGGNMAASLGARAGEVPAISVIGVNSSATVSGSLPITGAFHTINATLAVGVITLTQSTAFATNANETEEIGTTGQRVTGFRLTAGSAEDVRLKMVRFNQTGSASISDLANIVTVVDGTSYPTSVSSDGKYVTANLGSGVLIPEGNNVEIYLQYDIVGSNATGRTVIFDIDRNTDIFAEGVTYGYGISPVAPTSVPVPTTRGTFTVTSGTPYIYSTQVTIEGASVTTITKATEVPAQNIAVNVPNQPLGGFIIDLKGEAITVQSLAVTVATSSGSGSGLLTNVTIVDQNGSVVAGPVDATGAGTTLTFTDSITFPTGRNVYTIRGRVASGIGNNTIYTLSTNPSTQWTDVKGDTTGDSITISQSSFNMNAMTVRSAQLAVAVSTSPSAQTIVAGGQGVLFANIQLDASQSGEDVRLATIPLTYTQSGFGGAPSNLSSCQIKDGATVLNSGSKIVNPSATASTSPQTFGTFTFDNSLVIAKGTVKTLGVFCNVSSSAHTSSTYNIGITSAQIAALSVTGVNSSVSVTPTGSTGAGQTMTIASTGAVLASTAAGSPSYALGAAGSQGVTLGVYKFRATNEAVSLQRVGLKLTNTASSSASDLVQVTLHKADGTQIGSATFVGTDRNATSTLSSSLELPKDTDVEVTVKGWLASVGTSEPGTTGHLIAVDVDTAGTNTQGVGVQSGSTVNATGSTAVSGVRLFKSFPTISVDTGLGSTGVADGKLLRFRVTANSTGDVGISKFSLTIATTTATVTGINIFAFTDASYSTPVSGLTADGRMLATNNTAWASSATELEFYAQDSLAVSTTLQIPAGQTRYFEVRGSVAGATSGASITTTLLGDAAYPSLAASTFDGTAAAIDGDANDDMIWSPNTTGQAAVGTADWVNGFGIVGLPSAGQSVTRSAN